MVGDDGRREAPRLIAGILERFHETHRRELPELVRLAHAVDARGAAPGFAAAFEAIAAELEAHMDKEEMRLFPMLEQGGHTLAAHLIADMQDEHVAHRREMARVADLLAALPAATGAAAEAASLRAAFAKLAADLDRHIHAEDRDLFPRFLPRRPG